MTSFSKEQRFTYGTAAHLADEHLSNVFYRRHSKPAGVTAASSYHRGGRFTSLQNEDEDEDEDEDDYYYEENYRLVDAASSPSGARRDGQQSPRNGVGSSPSMFRRPLHSPYDERRLRHGVELDTRHALETATRAIHAAEHEFGRVAAAAAKRADLLARLTAKYAAARVMQDEQEEAERARLELECEVAAAHDALDLKEVSGREREALSQRARARAAEVRQAVSDAEAEAVLWRNELNERLRRTKSVVAQRAEAVAGLKEARRSLRERRQTLEGRIAGRRRIPKNVLEQRRARQEKGMGAEFRNQIRAFIGLTRARQSREREAVGQMAATIMLPTKFGECVEATPGGEGEVWEEVEADWTKADNVVDDLLRLSGASVEREDETHIAIAGLLDEMVSEVCEHELLGECVEATPEGEGEVWEEVEADWTKADDVIGAMLRRSVASLAESEEAGRAVDDLLRLSVSSVEREDETHIAIAGLLDAMVSEVCERELLSRKNRRRWRAGGKLAKREAKAHAVFTELSGYTIDGSDDPNAILAAFDHLAKERRELHVEIAAAKEKVATLKNEQLPAHEDVLQFHVQRLEHARRPDSVHHAQLVGSKGLELEEGVERAGKFALDAAAALKGLGEVLKGVERWVNVMNHRLKACLNSDDPTAGLAHDVATGPAVPRSRQRLAFPADSFAVEARGGYVQPTVDCRMSNRPVDGLADDEVDHAASFVTDRLGGYHSPLPAALGQCRTALACVLSMVERRGGLVLRRGANCAGDIPFGSIGLDAGAWSEAKARRSVWDSAEGETAGMETPLPSNEAAARTGKPPVGALVHSSLGFQWSSPPLVSQSFEAVSGAFKAKSGGGGCSSPSPMGHLRNKLAARLKLKSPSRSRIHSASTRPRAS